MGCPNGKGCLNRESTPFAQCLSGWRAKVPKEFGADTLIPVAPKFGNLYFVDYLLRIFAEQMVLGYQEGLSSRITPNQPLDSFFYAECELTSIPKINITKTLPQ